MTLRIKVAVAAVFALLAGVGSAQDDNRFSARLSWAPVSLSELRLVGGGGSATASLARNRLRIEGSFTDLPAVVTAVRLHDGVAPGASGPAIADLDASGNESGQFSGEVELNRRQREALVAGELYVQVYGEAGVPPDNSILRGWLFAESDQ